MLLLVRNRDNTVTRNPVPVLGLRVSFHPVLGYGLQYSHDFSRVVTHHECWYSMRYMMLTQVLESTPRHCSGKKKLVPRYGLLGSTPEACSGGSSWTYRRGGGYKCTRVEEHTCSVGGDRGAAGNHNYTAREMVGTILAKVLLEGRKVSVPSVTAELQKYVFKEVKPVGNVCVCARVINTAKYRSISNVCVCVCV